MESLNTYLATRSYVTGYKPTGDDASLFDSVLGGVAVTEESGKGLGNVYRWSKHINDFSADERKAWPKGDGVEAVQARINAAPSSKKTPGSPSKTQKDSPAAVSSPKKVNSPKKEAVASPKKEVSSPKKEAASSPKKAAKEEEEEEEIDDEDDPFADDDDDAEAAEALKKKLEKHKADLASGKVKATQRSMIVLDVKPFDEETDLEALATHIKSLTHEGIQNWGQEHKFVEVAYGIKKLVLSAVVFDDLCGVDEISDLIMEQNEDKVQSIDVAAMSKV